MRAIKNIGKELIWFKVQGNPLWSREGPPTSIIHIKVCKLLKECEEVIEENKRCSKETLKHTKENSVDKGDKSEEKDKNSKSQIPKR